MRLQAASTAGFSPRAMLRCGVNRDVDRLTGASRPGIEGARLDAAPELAQALRGRAVGKGFRHDMVLGLVLRAIGAERARRIQCRVDVALFEAATRAVGVMAREACQAVGL